MTKEWLERKLKEMADAGVDEATCEAGGGLTVIEAPHVVAKFRCNSVDTSKWGKNQQYHKVNLGAIYGTEGENADFAKATPSGAAWMQIDDGVRAHEFFEPQEDYYLKFFKAPKKQ
jgi:hypothetical protein